MAGTLWIVAGSNGAGKTTAVSTPQVRVLLDGVQFLNPDAVTLNKLRALGYSNFADVPDEELRDLFLSSANETEAEMSRILAEGGAVGIETVLSSEKYKSHVDSLIEAGGTFNLIYVSLASADLAVQRVDTRTAVGGHGVPEVKIRSRFVRSHKLMPWFMSRATTTLVFDNSRIASPTLVAMAADGVVTILDDDGIAPELRAALDAAKDL